MTPHRARDARGGKAFKMGAAGGVGRLSRDFAGWRAAAWFRQEGGANKGGGQKPTERGLSVIGQAVAGRAFCRRFRVPLVTWLR